MLEDWKKSPKGLQQKGALPKEEFNKLLKTLVVKLYENGAAAENLVSGFCKCGLYPFNPDPVYEKLPSRNIMSPQKALDQSLLQHLQNMREPQSAEEAVPMQSKRKRLGLEPGKSISTLDVPESDCDVQKITTRLMMIFLQLIPTMILQATTVCLLRKMP